ncbi:MAG TPA: response regulator transcription factor [Sphingomicrobium sp.]|nr:response regulator transcription factor [Sphingomicrobium sp.]
MLIVDDDVELGSMLVRFLAKEGFSARHVTSGAAALKRLSDGIFDLLIADVMMPQMDGLELLRRVRLSSAVPVLMLTARGGDSDRITGLELGADDYLPKPFNARELVARVRAILRRSPGRDPGGLTRFAVGPLALDSTMMSATLDGETVRLTTAEFIVLETLARAAGCIHTRGALSFQALGRPLEPFDRSIDTHVSNIRRKLGLKDGRKVDIRSSRGQGYVLIISDRAG